MLDEFTSKVLYHSAPIAKARVAKCANRRVMKKDGFSRYTTYAEILALLQGGADLSFDELMQELVNGKVVNSPTYERDRERVERALVELANSEFITRLMAYVFVKEEKLREIKKLETEPLFDTNPFKKLSVGKRSSSE